MVKKKATKLEILSLVGLLQHTIKVVKPGCTFLSQMYETAAKVKIKAVLLYQTHKRVPVRSSVVAYIYYQMEWYLFLSNIPK